MTTTVTMSYRTLGKSALEVSRLCLGTMMFADRTDAAEAGRIVAHARDHGVNFIDTADVYSRGGSETLLGDLLLGQREHWIVATKLGNAMADGADASRNRQRYSRRWMLAECAASLARLRMDHVDILYLHRDFLDGSDGMDLEEPLRAIDQLLRDGKIRYWGVSNFRVWRIAELVHTARALNIAGPVVCQPYYNLLNRQPEPEVLEVCAHHGIGVVPYSPLARGVLTAKYAPGAVPDPTSRAGRADKRMMQTEFREESLHIAQTLQAHCAGRGLSLAHFATAWVLAHRAVTSVIAGPRTLDQWQDYFGALALTLGADDEALVDRLVPPGHPSTPGYTDPAYPWAARRG